MRSVILSLLLRLVMGRLAWLKWRMRYGNPNTGMGHVVDVRSLADRLSG
jgi:hypothetical protein